MPPSRLLPGEGVLPRLSLKGEIVTAADPYRGLAVCWAPSWALISLLSATLEGLGTLMLSCVTDEQIGP